jgi:azurin
MRTFTTIFFALAMASSLGCSKADDSNNKGTANSMPTPPATTTEAPKPPPPPVESAKPAQHVELQIASVANTMTFDKNALTVPAGAEVHLTLKNNATMSTLPHNWVLVKPGTEASVAAAGVKMGEPAGYLDVRDKNILANTPQAKPGESAELTFTAPSEPGAYPYICTTPGHYLMMKGVLTVTP